MGESTNSSLRASVAGGLVCLVAGCAIQAPTPLENTYWKLTHLGDAPVTTPERQREAHFILHPADKRVCGSGGCNRFTGSYELEGDRLTFGRMAGALRSRASEIARSWG